VVGDSIAADGQSSGFQTTVDRPRVPERSMSNTSMCDDSKRSNIDPTPQDCSDPDCAFGWTTYVLNHAWKLPQTVSHKVSIHTLLHEKQDNPLLDPYSEDSIRYVHLPANNMTWVEVRRALSWAEICSWSLNE